jgi:alkanesulfonate monooxygenase
MPPSIAEDAMFEPRFGLWAPVYGPWGARHHPGEQAQTSYKFSRDIVVEAERLGFKTVMIAQHIINPLNNEYDQLETWSAAAGFAEATEDIELIGAVKPFFFHPAILAKIALGVDEISSGRFAINLISGWYMPEMEQAGLPIRDHEDRYSFSREWLHIVKSLWRDEAISFDGDHFKIKDLHFHPGPVAQPRPRIYLGGESEPARALAADEADVYLINGRPLELMRQLIADLRRRPRRNGQPLRFGTAGFVIARATQVEADEEHEYLAELAAPQDYTKLLKGIDPAVEMFKTFGNGPRGLGTNGGTSLGLVGDYDTIARRIVELSETGIETFLLQFQPMKSELRRFAEQIMPRVRELQRQAGRTTISENEARSYTTSLD